MAKPREPSSWKPSKKESDPDHKYLYVVGTGENKERKFPAKMERPYGSGKWVWSEKGLNSARNRAAQMISSKGMTQYIKLFNKATRLLNSEFGKDLDTWAEHKKQKSNNRKLRLQRLTLICNIRQKKGGGMSLRGRSLRLNRAFLRRNADDDRWVTLENGTRALIGGDGTIKGGFGGKYTGQKIGDIGKQGTVEMSEHGKRVRELDKQKTGFDTEPGKVKLSGGDVEVATMSAVSEKQLDYANDLRRKRMQDVDLGFEHAINGLTGEDREAAINDRESVLNSIALRDDARKTINDYGPSSLIYGRQPSPQRAVLRGVSDTTLEAMNSRMSIREQHWFQIQPAQRGEPGRSPSPEGRNRDILRRRGIT